MNVNKKMYIFEIFLLIYMIILKLLFIDANSYYKILIALSFPLITFLGYRIFGFQKDRTVIKTVSVQVTIITLLLFVFISYLSGLFFGFTKSQLDTSFRGIFNNIYYLVVMIVSEEIIRYIIAKKCNQNKNLPLVIITILFIIMDFFLMYNFKSYMNGYEVFLLITTSLLPAILRNVTASYLCYHASFLPGLILRLFYGVYSYIFPIYPDYGYYVTSIAGLLVPYIIYIINIKYINDFERTKEDKKIKKSLWYLNIPLFLIVVFFVTLITGTFKYQIIAIGSGSMEPTINYGDAVIFEHLRTDKEIKTLKKGDVLVFNHDNKYITHRIVKIYKTEKGVTYRTKGDNNKDKDNFIVNKKDVVGRITCRIRYLGGPTLWFNDTFNR